jgi:hypothetical protein
MVMSVMFPPIAIVFRHCEERSDEAIQLCLARSWIASLRSQ